MNNKSITTSSGGGGGGGAIHSEWGQKVTMFNNIFYNNEATGFNSNDDEIEISNMWNQSDMVLEIGYNSSNYEKTTLRIRL